MFTLRVNWNRSFDGPAYSVYSAQKYSVSNPAENGTRILRLDVGTRHCDGDRCTTEREVHLASGDRVFVMNEAGKTIDTIIA